MGASEASPIATAPGAPSALRYSVVVPVFNEAAVIGEFCRQAVSTLPAGFELLICYDIPADTTLPAIDALPAEQKPDRIRYIKNDLGPGVRYAIEAGMRAAQAPIIVVMMADVSDDFSVVEQLVRRAEAGVAVVCGSRYMRGGRQEGGPWLKGVLSRMAGATLHLLTGLPTWDATNSFKAYRKDFLDRTPIDSTAGFCLGLELTVKAHADGLRVEEVPTTWLDRAAGESRFRLWKWLPHYFQWYGWALDRSRRADAWAVSVVLLLALLLGLSHVLLRPEIYFRYSAWIFSESGNQLWRAFKIREGAVLYRDLALQYGPTPTYLFAAYTLAVGNTIFAAHLWHLLWSLINLGLCYAIMRRLLGVLPSVAVTGVLGIPFLLAPGGSIAAFEHAEFLPVERCCLLLLMWCWTTPTERSGTRSFALAALLELWQTIKFGGAYFGLAALLTADGLAWLWSGRQKSMRTTLHAALVVLGFAGLEGLRGAALFALLPPALAWDTFWPAYMQADYNTIDAAFRSPEWNGVRAFLTKQLLPLTCALIAATGGVEFCRRLRTSRESLSAAETARIRLWIGGFFYLFGSFAYFAHVHLFYQYCWVLMFPAVAVAVRAPVVLRVALAAAALPTLLLLVKTPLAGPTVTAGGLFSQVRWETLPSGERVAILQQEHADWELLSSPPPNTTPDAFQVAMLGWGGGGFQKSFNPQYDLRNPFVRAVAFRPYDDAELLSKLDRVDRWLMLGGADAASAEAEIRRTFSPRTADAIWHTFQFDRESSTKTIGVLRRAVNTLDRPHTEPAPAIE